MRTAGSFALCLLLTAWLMGCDDGGPDTDAGPAESDAGPDMVDAGAFEHAATPVLPSVSGTCPDLFSAETVSFSPAGGSARDVRVWITDAANDLDGPLVFYWHGAGGSPSEAPYALGAALAEINALGGVVVALSHDPGAGDFPWYLTTGSEEHDLLIADEVVACVIDQVGIDTTHIHSVGFSAGALHNSQMALRRSSYLASVVMYSGGVLARRRIPTDAPDARFAALLFHGGPSDIVLTNFEDATETYRAMLEGMDHFALVCDHGGGHTVPPAIGIESAWRFLQDHPYGSYPSPYADGLPSGFYDACQR